MNKTVSDFMYLCQFMYTVHFYTLHLKNSLHVCVRVD